MPQTRIQRDFPDEELIAHCRSPDAVFLGGTQNVANKVVQIGDNAVMKFGPFVTRFEYENLKLAKELVDPRILYIPDVYRFLVDDKTHQARDGELGYILMEYVHGSKIDPLDNPEQVRRIAEIVSHLASIRGEVPGPLSRGPCCGDLFPDRNGLTFDGVKGLEDFFNKRLNPQDPPKLNLEGVELVLCHLDIAPRNILWRDDGSICFLDWYSAGFYSRFFEFAVQRHSCDEVFNQMLLDAMMPPLSKEEDVQSLAVIVARSNCERYTL